MITATNVRFTSLEPKIRVNQVQNSESRIANVNKKLPKFESRRNVSRAICINR